MQNGFQFNGSIDSIHPSQYDLEGPNNAELNGHQCDQLDSHEHGQTRPIMDAQTFLEKLVI